MKKGLVTKGAYKKLTEGHPWLNPTEVIDRTLIPKRPCAFQFAGRWWFCSPESFLRLRRIGPPQEGWMHNPSFNVLTNADQFQSYFGNWMLRHFTETLERKITSLKLDLSSEDLCLRWIFSENDFFPGLIVDIFGLNIVVQINSAPIEIFWLHIEAALSKAYTEITKKVGHIWALRNSPIRKKEGLEIIQTDPTDANQPQSAESLYPILRWNGLRWRMTPAGSQKTGAYFDQRENHTMTATLAKKYKFKEAWDLCSYQGGFSLHLLKAGLAVTAIDQSAEALAQANENCRLNDLPKDKFNTVRADVFTWLNTQIENKASTDLIVLDPPSFVKSRTEIASALRGYREINTLSLQCLRAGGLLVSCVCSQHITKQMYWEVLQESALLTTPKSKITLLEAHGPSSDHLPAAGFAEGQYLQAWYILKS